MSIPESPSVIPENVIRRDSADNSHNNGYQFEYYVRNRGDSSKTELTDAVHSDSRNTNGGSRTLESTMNRLISHLPVNSGIIMREGERLILKLNTPLPDLAGINLRLTREGRYLEPLEDYSNYSPHSPY